MSCAEFVISWKCHGVVAGGSPTVVLLLLVSSEHEHLGASTFDAQIPHKLPYGELFVHVFVFCSIATAPRQHQITADPSTYRITGLPEVAAASPLTDRRTSPSSRGKRHCRMLKDLAGTQDGRHFVLVCSDGTVLYHRHTQVTNVSHPVSGLS